MLRFVLSLLLAVSALTPFQPGDSQIGRAISPPQLLSKVEPNYCEGARQRGVEGTVVLAAVVDADGAVRTVKVLRSLDVDLDLQAIEAVKKWRFRPGMKDGHAVPVVASIEVTFRLTRDPSQNVPKVAPQLPDPMRAALPPVRNDVQTPTPRTVRWGRQAEDVRFDSAYREGTYVQTITSRRVAIGASIEPYSDGSFRAWVMARNDSPRNIEINPDELELSVNENRLYSISPEQIINSDRAGDALGNVLQALADAFSPPSAQITDNRGRVIGTVREDPATVQRRRQAEQAEVERQRTAAQASLESVLLRRHTLLPGEVLNARIAYFKARKKKQVWPPRNATLTVAVDGADTFVFEFVW